MVEETQAFQVSIGGKQVNVRGVVGFLSVFILLLMGAVAYLGIFSLSKWGTPVDIADSFAQQRDLLDRHERLVTGQHRIFSNSMDELTYVISKCLDKRNHTDCPDVAMPDSLRRKLRDNQ